MSNESKFRITVETLLRATGIRQTISLFNSLIGVLGKVGAAGKKAFNTLKTGLDIITKPLQWASKAFAALGAALAGTVIEGARFNVQMARVWTMAGGGIAKFKELRNEARGLAQEFGLARSEMASGFYKALSSEVNANDLHEFMKVAAKAAVADGSDIVTAIDGITTVLDSFGMKSAEAAKMADLMFQSVAKGKLTFQDLAQYISQAASVASAMGVSAEQVFAAVSQLSKTQEVSTATVNLRNIMLSLNKALGEGWAESMSLQEAMQTLYTRIGGSQLKLEEIVGRENITAFLKLVGANAKEADRLLKEMGYSAGALDTAFDKVQQFRHWETTVQSVRGWLSKMGEELDQRLAPLIDAIGAKFRAWTVDNAFWEKVGKILNTAASNITAAFHTAADAASRIKREISSSGEGLGKIINSFLLNGVSTFFSAFMAALKASISMWKLFGSVVASAIKEELFKTDLPGVKGMRERAARENVGRMSQEDANEFIKQNNVVSGYVLDYWKEQGKDLRELIWGQLNSGNLSKDAEASLAASFQVDQTEIALKEFEAEMTSIGKKLRQDLGDDIDALSAAISGLTGESYSLKHEFEMQKIADEQRRISEESYRYKQQQYNQNDSPPSSTAAPAAKSPAAAQPAPAAAPAEGEGKPSRMMGGGSFSPMMDDYSSPDFRSSWPGSEAAAPAAAAGDDTARAVKDVGDEVSRSGSEMKSSVKGLEQSLSGYHETNVELMQELISGMNSMRAELSTLASQISNSR